MPVLRVSGVRTYPARLIRTGAEPDGSLGHCRDDLLYRTLPTWFKLYRYDRSGLGQHIAVPGQQRDKYIFTSTMKSVYKIKLRPAPIVSLDL